MKLVSSWIGIAKVVTAWSLVYFYGEISRIERILQKVQMIQYDLEAHLLITYMFLLNVFRWNKMFMNLLSYLKL